MLIVFTLVHLQLLRPDFSTLLSKQQENEIFTLIGKLIQTLSSPEIAIDDRHTPRLYARFLAGLLTRHRREGTNTSRQQHPPPPPPPQNQHPAPSKGDYSSSNTSSTTFSQQQPQGGGMPSQQPHDGGYTQALYSESEKPETAIYQAPADLPYSSPSTRPIEFYTSGDFGPVNNLSDEDMLATMYALKNPAWWQNMMMPGYVGCCLALRTTADPKLNVLFIQIFVARPSKSSEERCV